MEMHFSQLVSYGLAEVGLSESLLCNAHLSYMMMMNSNK
jgi:hypothetical protein